MNETEDWQPPPWPPDLTPPPPPSGMGRGSAHSGSDAAAQARHGEQRLRAETGPQRKGFGPAQVVTVAVAAAVVGAAVVSIVWLVSRADRAKTPDRGVAAAPGSNAARTATETLPAVRPSASASPSASLPDTDELGFLDYRFARCDPADLPAVMARTTNSVLVICGYASDYSYYRAQRLSDGAGIELADAVPTEGGFAITNPADGTRYEIRPSELTIVLPDGRRISEPMVEYAAR